MNIITLPLGPLATNCYLVCDQTGGVCAVIDPGASAQKILARAQDEGCKIAAILLTHAHFDHTGALHALHEALPQVPIYVHPADTDNAHNMSHGNLVYTDTYEECDTVRVGALGLPALRGRALLRRYALRGLVRQDRLRGRQHRADVRLTQAPRRTSRRSASLSRSR